MSKFLLFLLGIILAVSSVQAQDKIHRKNGQILKVKIIEIGVSEIKYKLHGDENGPVYVLEKDRIKKIEYENGSTEKMTINLKDPEQYADQLSKGIKIDFLGPLMGYSQITYEKSTGVGKGYELTLGVIGAGKNQTLEYYDNTFRTAKRNQFGVSVAAGYKFSKLPDFIFQRTRFTHLMQGGYVKPALYLGNYSENRLMWKANSQYVVERQNIMFGALQIEVGKQWIFGDKFMVDLYWGFGYGFDNKQGNGYWYDDDLAAYNYINARLGRSPGFSTTFGLKTGLLIK
jgi:hypothetical protein